MPMLREYSGYCNRSMIHMLTDQFGYYSDHEWIIRDVKLMFESSGVEAPVIVLMAGKRSRSGRQSLKRAYQSIRAGLSWVSEV